MKVTMKFVLILLSWVWMLGCSPMNQVRYPAARWVKDDDRRPIAKPKAREQYRFEDIAEYQFFKPIENMLNLRRQGENLLGAMGISAREEALNTNNFDEVADSTWFTNRLGRHEMSLEEIRRGPDSGLGPHPKEPWIVLAAKTQGISPGFFIQDAKGDKYLLKFDPPGHLNLATSAELISTKIFYALGYNVAENYLVDFKPGILQISPQATKKDKKGKRVPLTEADITPVFRRLPPVGEGVYRALASKFLTGESVGPFAFLGKRNGDSNDRVPHQHRRELRGYRVFSSWVDHFDSRQANTLDTFVETEPGKGHLIHYLIDFGSTLGSSAVKPKEKPHRNDYVLNYAKVGASLVTLGAYYPDWEKIPDSGLLSVAVFDSTEFNPESWRPQYPNPVFQNMTLRDAFWAAKILLRFSDEMVRAIVQEARYGDPRATEYVAHTLIERKKKILNAWLRKMNPLDAFQWETGPEGGQLRFEDLMIQGGLEPKDSGRYRYRLVKAKAQQELIRWTDFVSPSLSIPRSELDKMKPKKSYLLQLQTRRENESHWSPKIDLILQKEGDVSLQGLFRHYP